MEKFHHFSHLNSFPNDKILDLIRFKAFADDKIIVTQKLKIVKEMVENIVGKENAGYQHFHFFLQCFQKAPSKLGLYGREVTLSQTTKFWT